MLWSEIPKEDDRHIKNPRYFKQEREEEPRPRFVVDGVLAAKKIKRQTKRKSTFKKKETKKAKSV